MEEFRTIFSVIALLISFWSAYTVRRLWYQAHRPIVSAAIRENSSGIGTVLFDLVLLNSGNRPATEIQLLAKETDIDKILITTVSKEKRKEVYDLFKRSKIQLLPNGEEAKTFFYAYAVNPKNSMDILDYESQLPITIHYRDLENRLYTSKQVLYVRDHIGFGGSIWEDKGK